MEICIQFGAIIRDNFFFSFLSFNVLDNLVSNFLEILRGTNDEQWMWYMLWVRFLNRVFPVILYSYWSIIVTVGKNIFATLPWSLCFLLPTYVYSDYNWLKQLLGGVLFKMFYWKILRIYREITTMETSFLRPSTLIKKGAHCKCFPVNRAKFLAAVTIQNT